MIIKKFDIATAKTARSTNWHNKSVCWADIVEMLKAGTHTDETMREFLALGKEEQGAIKDSRGGFVGGYIQGGKRRKGNVQSRSLLCLDADSAGTDFWINFTLNFDCAAVVHGTHKHTPANPRLRLVIPLSEDVDAEAYEAIGRAVTSQLGINQFDKTTYEPERLMYMPTIPRDMEYYFETQDGDALDVKAVLGSYADWTDRSSWAMHEGESESIARVLTEAPDPRKKSGIIGAFCRAYTIDAAISTFLSDVYAPAREGRYTYLAGTSAGGLTVWDDTLCYSRHDHDAANNGHAVNAYDLVRIHKYTKGYSEAEGLDAFRKVILSDKLVTTELAKAQMADAAQYVDDFDALCPDSFAESAEGFASADWQIDKKGNIKSTITNYKLALQTDKLLSDLISLDEFQKKLVVTREVPWRNDAKGTSLCEVDKDAISDRLETILECFDKKKIESAINLVSAKNSFHPVKDYLQSLKWDGVKRVDTALIDYLGAEDNIYTREAFRIMLLGAISRVYAAGYKFDTALIMYSGQGAGKSTFVNKLGKEWATDSVTTLGKTSSFEQLRGKWIVELAELSALQKTDIETVKVFLSKQTDTYRPAYGRDVVDFDRQCVFFGSTNKLDFLQDATGNRRFMPVTVKNIGKVPFMMSDDFNTVVDQLWAEAHAMYLSGNYATILSSDAELIAGGLRIEHYEEDGRTPLVRRYLSTMLPSGWAQMQPDARKSWLRYGDASMPPAEQRNTVSALEIWVECLSGLVKDFNTIEARKILQMVGTMDDWQPVAGKHEVNFYGSSKVFVRIDDTLLY